MTANTLASADQPFTDVAAVVCDPPSARVYEHGWQSGSPTTTYGLRDRYRPVGETTRVMCYRPHRPVPEGCFQGEGLLAVQEHADGPVHVFAGRPGATAVPSIRGRVQDNTVVVASDGEIEQLVDHGPGGMVGALGRWGDRHVDAVGVGPIRPAPRSGAPGTSTSPRSPSRTWWRTWTASTGSSCRSRSCSWTTATRPGSVTGWRCRGASGRCATWWPASGIGAGARGSGRCRPGRRPLPAVRRASRVAGGGRVRRPQLGPGPVRPRHHPSRRGRLPSPGALEVPRARHRLLQARLPLRRGAGRPAPPGRAAGGSLQARPAAVREAIGPDAYLLGCGAPILPSVGLVDAMRVSPDIGASYEPPQGDLSQGSQRSAVLSGVGRAWQHGRFWVNDPDCLLARSQMQRREGWAAHIERYGGLRGSSDRLRDLDQWGVQTTQRLLSTVPPPTPFALEAG